MRMCCCHCRRGFCSRCCSCGSSRWRWRLQRRRLRHGEPRLQARLRQVGLGGCSTGCGGHKAVRQMSAGEWRQPLSETQRAGRQPAAEIAEEDGRQAGKQAGKQAALSPPAHMTSGIRLVPAPPHAQPCAAPPQPPTPSAGHPGSPLAAGWRGQTPAEGSKQALLAIGLAAHGRPQPLGSTDDAMHALQYRTCSQGHEGVLLGHDRCRHCTARTSGSKAVPYCWISMCSTILAKNSGLRYPLRYRQYIAGSADGWVRG